MSASPSSPPPVSLARAAADVLAGNDSGGWTRPAPRQYPHQWSWDSAFAAIGWAQVDVERAMSELEHLFAAQWRTGLVPYLVYDAGVPADAYFPDAGRWDSHRSAAAPAGIATGGLGQPPVHALALLRIWRRAVDLGAETADRIRPRVRALYPAVLAWHRYLATARDPQGSGLVTVYHPWESGTDNSPRWDAPLDRLVVGDLPPFVRRDRQIVTDASQRPTDLDYRRYLWLLELIKRRRFDEAVLAAEHPFAVKDVLFSSIFAAANEALLELGDAIAAADQDRTRIEQWLARTASGLQSSYDPDLGLCLDQDLRTGERLTTRTVAGLAPLLVRGIDTRLQRRLLLTLESPAFLGSPRLRADLLPSTSPLDDAFDPRRYWRGPSWPVITWLFGTALAGIGQDGLAARLRAAALHLLATEGFCEYFDAQTGEGLGSPDQTWTAAVALDWPDPAPTDDWMRP